MQTIYMYCHQYSKLGFVFFLIVIKEYSAVRNLSDDTGSSSFRNPPLCLSERSSRDFVSVRSPSLPYRPKVVAESPHRLKSDLANSSTLVVVFAYNRALHRSWT